MDVGEVITSEVKEILPHHSYHNHLLHLYHYPNYKLLVDGNCHKSNSYQSLCAPEVKVKSVSGR